MSSSVLAIGLLVAFIGVVWMAMVLWGLICPPVTSAPKKRLEPHLPSVSTQRPIVQQRSDERMPAVVMPEAPAIAAVELPDDDKVVSLSQWRERRKQAG